MTRLKKGRQKRSDQRFRKDQNHFDPVLHPRPVLHRQLIPFIPAPMSDGFPASTPHLPRITAPSARTRPSPCIRACNWRSVRVPRSVWLEPLSRGHLRDSLRAIDAWGATPSSSYLFPDRHVSIHVPAWGATIKGMAIAWASLSFNPRPRMGGDAQYRVTIEHVEGFNPRPRMGGDGNLPDSILHMSVFQSMPPHGGRHRNKIIKRPVFQVSIHAPAWGATQSRSFSRQISTGFNPRPRMGGDLRLNTT